MTHRGMRPAARPLAALLICLALLTGACTPVNNPQPTATTSASASPRAASLEQAIEDYATAGTGNLENITSVLVSVDGKLVTEHYRARGSAGQQTHLWSVTKSVLATLVGIAVGEGRLTNLDATLRTLLPRHTDAMSSQTSGITLRQLLTMTAGMPGDDVLFEVKDTKLETFLSLPLASNPGTEFLYSSASAHLVAAVLTEALDRPLLDYAREKLFDPLQISTRPAYTGKESLRLSPAFARAGFSWARTTDGIYHGCCLMKLTGRDMQKLGQLYLNQGRWQGRQIVPASWVAQATRPTTLSPEYGYLWWVGSIAGRNAYQAVGHDGQLIQVIPELKAVITVSSWSNPDRYLDAGMIFPVIEDVIVPRIS